MSALRVDLEPSFVLHRRPYRDSSLLVELYTREHGRIGLVARGARRPKSPLRGALQPFTPLRISWSSRGELGTLRQVESGNTLMLHGEAAMSGFYVNELLMRLTQRNDPSTELFGCYSTVLDELSNTDHPGRPLRLFEKRLLEALGYGLNLGGEGTNIDSSGVYRFRVDEGPVRVRDDAPSEQLYRGKSLLSLHEEELRDPASLEDARRLLRAALEWHLGGRELNSRRVMRALRRQMQ